MQTHDHHTILIADDEESVRYALKGILTDEGYEVLEACDGRETMDILSRVPVALLLADLDMPRLDGLEILKKIKSEKSLTQVMIITGKGTINTAVEAMKEGAYDYLTKPVDPQRL